MTLNRAQQLVLSTLICSMLVLSAGCQSGGFKPDLGRLAFWKKGDVQLASRNVAPPSAHFNPDRGDSSKSIADAGQQNLKNSVDAIIAEAKRNKEMPKDPTRQPYSLGGIESKIGGATKAANDFVGNNPLQGVQQSASTAVQSTKDTIQQVSQLAQNPGSAISGLTSDVQQRSQHAASQIASGVSEGLTRQANNIVSGATGAANNMINAASNGIRQTVNTVQENADNSFQPGNADSDSGVQHNPYLGALNNSSQDFANAASNAGNDNQNSVAQAVNSISVPDANTPKYQMVTASTGQTADDANRVRGATNSGFLQPLNNQIVVPAQPPTSSYPSTPFGTIQPVQQNPASFNSSSLPAALLKGTANFTPGSTKPLQPLR